MKNAINVAGKWGQFHDKRRAVYNDYSLLRLLVTRNSLQYSAIQLLYYSAGMFNKLSLANTYAGWSLWDGVAGRLIYHQGHLSSM